MITTSGRLALPYILQSQSQKEVTHNEAITMLDILTQSVVLDVDINTPPGSPAVGDSYIIGNSPTDDWAGKAANLVQAQEGGVWFFVPPVERLKVWVSSAQRNYEYDGTAWVADTLLAKDTGEFLRVAHLSEDITVSGASTSSIIEIPDRALVLSVNVRVITAITGATTFDVGVSGDAGRYGTTIGVALDSTSVGMSSSPLAYYANTPLLLTANGGSFSGGVVRTTIQYLQTRGPWTW